MDAVISGRAGVALLIQDGNLSSLHLEDPKNLVQRSPSEVSLLLGDASDLRFLEDAELPEVLQELEQARNFEDALHLTLILVDGDLSQEVRKEAAEVLEELLSDGTVALQVRNILYAYPVPATAEIELGLGSSRISNLENVSEFLTSLVKYQGQIRDVRLAWDAIPVSVFGSAETRDSLETAIAKAGLFQDLVLFTANRTDIKSFLIHVLTGPTRYEFRQHTGILELWAGTVLLPSDERRPSVGRRRTSAELQTALARLWREFKERHSARARTTLIEHYRYLIPKARQRIIPTIPVKVAPEVLDQEGYGALLQAVDQFDSRSRFKFEAFAISTIRNAMVEYLRREEWVPRRIRSQPKRLNQTEGDCSVLDRSAVGYLEMPGDVFGPLYYEANILQPVSLEDVVEDSDLDPLVLLEYIKSKEPDPHVMAIVESQKSLLIRCIGWLPPLERTVVFLYYYEGWTLKLIAKEIERSERRAHQLRSQAIGRLSAFIARQRGLFLPELLPVPEHAELQEAFSKLPDPGPERHSSR